MEDLLLEAYDYKKLTKVFILFSKQQLLNFTNLLEKHMKDPGKICHELEFQLWDCYKLKVQFDEGNMLLLGEFSSIVANVPVYVYQEITFEKWI